jgi:S-formylglutathione hydrolase FrmB
MGWRMALMLSSLCSHEARRADAYEKKQGIAHVQRNGMSGCAVGGHGVVTFALEEPRTNIQLQ